MKFMRSQCSILLGRFFVCGLASLLLACGGGGGGGGVTGDGATGVTPPGPVTPGTTPPTTPPVIPPVTPPVTPPAALNPVAGSLFFGEPGALSELDLASGLVTVIRAGAAGGVAGADGSEHPTLDVNAFRGSNTDAEFRIIRRDGTTAAKWAMPEYVGGTPALSPDGQKIVFSWAHSNAGESAYTPTVFNRQGQVLRRFFGYSQARWMPDGGLMLIKGDSL
jgi:WD40-like Beta Propeller Repeat